MITNDNTPIISIAIPTYNRAERLQENLTHLANHAEFFQDWVEIVISDNASSDNTSQIVAAFSQRTGKDVRYVRNVTNLGIDANIHTVSRIATGRYLLLMSDDDLLLPGALTRLRQIVEETPDLLFCFVNNGFFSGLYDPKTTLSKSIPLNTSLVTQDPNVLLKEIGVWSTFLSSFFVDRKAWISVPSADSFIGSEIYLTHILFRMLCAERGRISMVTEEILVAGRNAYTGSFRPTHAFGFSFLSLLVNDAPGMGLDSRSMRQIKLDVIRRKLPEMVFMVRRYGSKHRWLSVNELRSIMHYTWYEPSAWVYLFPIIILPVTLLNFLNHKVRYRVKLALNWVAMRNNRL